MEKYTLEPNFDDFLNDKSILPFEDYSNELVKRENNKLGTFYEYKNCKNNNIILESSFNTLLNTLKNKDWVIISAFRKGFDKKENIKRNRLLRGIFNSHKAGVYQLVGHLQENPQNMEYDEARDKNLLIDTIERSYLVPKPKDMDITEFKNLMINSMTIDGKTQDAIVFHTQDDAYYIILNNGNMEKIGDKISFNKIAQAYSQWVRKLNVPFVFEGVERPGSNSGSIMFKIYNILY